MFLHEDIEDLSLSSHYNDGVADHATERFARRTMANSSWSRIVFPGTSKMSLLSLRTCSACGTSAVRGRLRYVAVSALKLGFPRHLQERQGQALTNALRL